MNKTETGLRKETAAALSYVLGPFSGLMFLVLEAEPFVRFHAMQSIVISVVMLVVDFILVATIIFSFLLPAFVIVEFVLWLVLIYKASQGQKWSVPVLGKLVTQFLH